MTVQVHKNYKSLPERANLRDHMSPIELALISLGEATAVTLHRNRDSMGFNALKQDAEEAGQATGDAGKTIEKKLGRSAASRENYLRQPENPERRQLSFFDVAEEK